MMKRKKKEGDNKSKKSEKEKKQEASTTSEIKKHVILDEKQAAQELAITRIFTDEDFKRIDMENIKKHTKGARKRPLEAEKSEYVRLDDIEMIFKKKKNDKQARLESVLTGRFDREKFGYKDGRKKMNIVQKPIERNVRRRTLV